MEDEIKESDDWKCVDCIWFEMLNTVNGRCQRNPPKLMMVPSPLGQPSMAADCWPVVTNEGWCGEFERVENNGA